MEERDAAEEGIVAEGGESEHPDGNGSGEAAEAGRGYRAEQGGKEQPAVSNVFRLVPKGAPPEDEDAGPGVEEFLMDLLQRLKDGRIKPSALVVHYLDEAHDGNLRHGYWTWHCPPIEHLGLLAVAESDVIRHQQNG